MVTKPLTALAALLITCATFAAEPAYRTYGSWHSSEIGGGGYLQQVHFCPSEPNRLYMSSDVGGVFRSDDQGKSWRMLHGALPPGGGAYEIRGLLVEAANADHVLVACGNPWGAHRGIFVTTNGGKTWKQTLRAMFPGNGDARCNGKILVSSPADTKLLLAAADEGVFRSGDFGETWEQVPGLADLFSPSDIVFDRSDAQRVWLCIPGNAHTTGLFTSRDGGNSFTRLSDKSPSEIVQDPQDATILYGLMDRRPVRSRDLGNTWEAFDRPLPAKGGARDDGTYAAIAAAPGFVVTGGHGGHFYRLDRESGQWTKIQRGTVDEQQWWGRMRPGMYSHFGSALGYIAIDPRDASHWYFTDWYACYETRDGGRDWTLRIDGVEMTVIHTVVPDLADAKTVHVGMADVGYFRSADGGRTFSWGHEGVSNNIKSIATTPAKPSRLYAVGPQRWEWHANQVFISDDSGGTWRRSPMEGLPDMAQARCNTIVASPANGDEVYITISGNIAPGQGGVYRSDDAGQSWKWTGEGLPSDGGLFRKDIWVHGPELAASGDHSLVAISCDRRKLMRFDGRKWLSVAVPAGGGANALIADPGTNGRYYLAMREGGLYRSDDAGTTWGRLTQRTANWVAVDPRSAQHLAVTTDDGVIASTDGGATWIDLDPSQSLPYRHRRNVLAVSGGRVYVGTGGNGVFWSDLPADADAAR